MNFAALVFLALAMSTDAFAAAIGKGASMQKPRFYQAIRIGLLFGVIEAITPVIGWAAGSFATHWVSEWDHWIAFVLLIILGSRMIWVGLTTKNDHEEKPNGQPFITLALTAVATSIDALAVGVSLAFVDVNIIVAALMIGLATTIMVTIGIMIGRMVGSIIGKGAEIIGGMVLIGVGASILYDHTGYPFFIS